MAKHNTTLTRYLLVLVFLFSAMSFVKAATITSNAVTGNWSAGASWVGDNVPGGNDIAIIANGAVITVDAATSVTSFTVNAGGILIATGFTLTYKKNNTMTINGTVTINATGGITDGGTSAGTIININSGATINDAGGIFAATGGTITVNAGANWNYNGGAQTMRTFHTTLNNLTLSGSGLKTLAANQTVNGIMSMQGTATFSLSTFTFSYGANATLKYAGSSTQTTGPEFLSTFGGSGGLIIDNSSGVLLANNTTVSGALEINPSAKFTVNSSVSLTVNGTTILNGGSECLIIKSEGSFKDNGITGGGTARVEKSLAHDRWWYVGSPISSATAGGAFGITATPIAGEGTRLYYWDAQSTKELLINKLYI